MRPLSLIARSSASVAGRSRLREARITIALVALLSVARGSLGVMVALVTGAAVGIGRAIALALLARGMDTWLADRQDPEGPEGRFVRLDMTDDAALRSLIVEAGIETGPHRSPAYAAAKAGLIRLTTAYDGPARVNCIVPGWIATPRGLREAAAMTEPERAAAGPMVAMETITAAVSDLLADDTARGRVVVLR